MGSFAKPVAHSRGYGKITQGPGTANTPLIEPVAGCWTNLTYVAVTCGTTAHTLYVLRPQGFTFVNSAAAASQAVININEDPGKFSTYAANVAYLAANPLVLAVRLADNTLAANDYVCYQVADGTYVLDTVSSVTSLAVTMTNNVPACGVLKGAPFWWFGIQTDTNPCDGNAHPAFTLPASTVTKLGAQQGEGNLGFMTIVPHPAMFNFKGTAGGVTYSNVLNGKGLYGMPMMLYDANTTAADTIEEVVVEYSDR